MGLAITICGMYYAPEHTGSAPYIAGIARGLAERGHQVTMVTGFPHYPSWDAGDVPWRSVEHDQGVEVVRLRHYVPSDPSSLRRIAYETSFGGRAVASRWGRPDVVLLTSPTLLSSAMAAVRVRWGRRRPPLGVVVHDLYGRGASENLGQGGAVVSALERVESMTLRAADGVTVIHDRFRDVLRDDLAVPEDKVTVIRNWTHIEPVAGVDRASVRARLGWGDEVVVLHAGNMGAKQGLSHVVEAARRADEQAAPVRFALLGDGNQRAELEQAGRGIRSLQFIAPLPDREFVEALAAADVLLVHEKPGLSESAVPSKLTSYFAAGNAVLGALDPEGVTAQELRESGGGVVIAAGDPSNLVDAAVELGRDPRRRAALAESGLLHTQETLSEKRALDRYDTWVRDLSVVRGR